MKKKKKGNMTLKNLSYRMFSNRKNRGNTT